MTFRAQDKTMLTDGWTKFLENREVNDKWTLLHYFFSPQFSVSSGLSLESSLCSICPPVFHYQTDVQQGRVKGEGWFFPPFLYSEINLGALLNLQRFGPR